MRSNWATGYLGRGAWRCTNVGNQRNRQFTHLLQRIAVGATHTQIHSLTHAANVGQWRWPTWLSTFVIKAKEISARCEEREREERERADKEWSTGATCCPNQPRLLRSCRKRKKLPGNLKFNLGVSNMLEIKKEHDMTPFQVRALNLTSLIHYTYHLILP